MKVVTIDRETWLSKSYENAHKAVFGDEPVDMNESLFDAALLVIDEEADVPIIYTTVKQTTASQVFIEYGGSFPDYRGSPKVKPAFELLCNFLHEAGASRVSLATKNTNIPMQRLALSTGFTPWGMTFGKTGLFLEYIKSFQEEK